MPPAADDVWFRPFAVGAPFFGIIFVYITQGLWEFDGVPSVDFWISISISILLGVVIYLFTEKATPPKWSILFSLATFVISVLWI